MTATLLKQSTAFTFRIGPFVDDTDGVSPETVLTIAQADIQISKNGGAFAQTSASSPTTTHDADGWYQCPLTTTDTATLGPLTVQVTMSGALPVWREFLVVPAAVYNALVNGTGTGIRSDVFGFKGTEIPATTDSNIANNFGQVWDNNDTVESTYYLTHVFAAATNITQIESTDATDAIQASCLSALQSIHLDHWMAAACASAQVVDDSLAAQMISKSATATYTSFDNTTDSLEAIRDRGDSAWVTGGSTTAGSGAYVVTVHVEDDAAVDLENAQVRCVDNNGAGSTVNTLLTDSSGDAVFALDAGTWQISISKSGYQGEVNSGVVISASTTLNYDIDGSAITASSAGLSTGHMTCYDENGAVESGVTISVKCVKPPAGSTGLAADNKVRTDTSDVNGYVEFTNMLQGFTYEVWRGTSTEADVNSTPAGGAQEIIVPTTSPFELTTVIGNDE